MSQFNYFIIYLVLEIFCGAQAALMAAKMTSDIGYSTEVRVFRQLSVCLIIEVIAESLWLIFAGSGARVVLYLSCAADLISTGYTVYFWFRFMDLQVTPRAELIERPRYVDVLWTVPVGIMTVLDITSPLTGLSFSLTAEEVYQRGPLFPLHALCCFFYAIPVIALIVRSRKQQNFDRQRARVYLNFPILLTFGGVLQIVYGHAPFLTLTFTFGMLLLYSALQRRQINTDALTRLNNRASAGAYLKGRLETAESSPFYLFMADIDQFKGINDQYGHIMGDEALVLVADTLRDLAKDYRTLFISRYGGDEFLFTIAAHEVDPERLKRRFAVDLAKALEASGHPFRFTVSLGCALADTSGISQKALIDQADKGMYNWKNDRK
jgi:diguanylate cyclase (GGDEF)-like protein